MITLEEALQSGRGIERSFNCPAHEDSNASASVNVNKNVWFCYACNATGTVSDEFAIAVDVVRDVSRLLEKDKEPEILPEAWLDLFDANYPSEYWSHRYGERVAVKHRCGTDPVTGAPTYPIRDTAGRVLGVVLRQENSKCKYMYPAGVPVSTTLYTLPESYFNGSYRRTPVVVLLEGAPDVMALDQAGIPDTMTCFGVFGAGLSYPQAEIIKTLSPRVVVAAFDDDNAGTAAVLRAQQQLAGVCEVLSVGWSTFGGKDPGDIPIDHRIDAIRQSLAGNPLTSRYA